LGGSGRVSGICVGHVRTLPCVDCDGVPLPGQQRDRGVVPRREPVRAVVAGERRRAYH
jgi:hypothetical protein